MEVASSACIKRLTPARWLEGGWRGGRTATTARASATREGGACQGSGRSPWVDTVTSSCLSHSAHVPPAPPRPKPTSNGSRQAVLALACRLVWPTHSTHSPCFLLLWYTHPNQTSTLLLLSQLPMNAPLYPAAAADSPRGRPPWREQPPPARGGAGRPGLKPPGRRCVGTAAVMKGATAWAGLLLLLLLRHAAQITIRQ
jgi:hypothetical protein